jgi:hypothetical protein
MNRIYIGVDFHALQQNHLLFDILRVENSAPRLKHQLKTRGNALSTRSSRARVIVGWRPAVTAPGSNDCWKNWAAKYGLGTPRKFAAVHAGVRKTIGATRN